MWGNVEWTANRRFSRRESRGGEDRFDGHPNENAASPVLLSFAPYLFSLYPFFFTLSFARLVDNHMLHRRHTVEYCARIIVFVRSITRSVQRAWLSSRLYKNNSLFPPLPSPFVAVSHRLLSCEFCDSPWSIWNEFLRPFVGLSFVRYIDHPASLIPNSKSLRAFRSASRSRQFGRHECPSEEVHLLACFRC